MNTALATSRIGVWMLITFCTLLLAIAGTSASAKRVSSVRVEQVPDESVHSIQVRATFHGLNESYAISIEGLDVVLTNDSSTLLTILWDECVMVFPSGISERVIHTGVRIIDKAAPQAPTAIAPHSSAHETVWPSSHVSSSGDPEEYLLLGDLTVRLYLTIQDSTGKHTEDWAWRFWRLTYEIPDTPAPPEAPAALEEAPAPETPQMLLGPIALLLCLVALILYGVGTKG
jgi:hypothetical protein